MKTKLIFFSLCFVVLSGCVSSPPMTAEESKTLFADHLFTPPAEPIDASKVFELSPAMRKYLKFDIAKQLRDYGAQQGLFNALYATEQLRLEYDTGSTRTAADAFAMRAGNCLSLAIMTAALARELNLAAHFQGVFVEEHWSRSGDLYFSSGHINVTIGPKPAGINSITIKAQQHVIDFIRPDPNKRQHTWDLREDTVIAMFLNNRAAETLIRGDVNGAYWWARAAIKSDPKYLAAYNTLGVIYRRAGHVTQAEHAMQLVVNIEPDNTPVLANLAIVLKQQGRIDEADKFEARLAQLQPNPPFHFFNLGLAAMRERRFEAARDYFQQEVNRAAYNDEFHFWLAASYYALNDAKHAQTHLQLAIENSATRKSHDLYVAKLDIVNSKTRVNN
jgi:Tfp pilus assembly protein PilF